MTRRVPRPLAQRWASVAALLFIPRARCNCKTTHGETVMLQQMASITTVSNLANENRMNPHVTAADDCNATALRGTCPNPRWILDGSPGRRQLFQNFKRCEDVRHVEPDLNNGTCDTRQSTSHVKRVAVLLRGQSFRLQKWSHQETDQYVICRSHVEILVQPLEKAGYEVDVYLVTNPTGRNSSFWTGLFGTRLKLSQEIEPARGLFTNHQGRHVAAALDLVQGAIAHSKLEYRFIVMLRNDLMLKKGDFVEKILNDTRIDSTFLLPFMTYDAPFPWPAGHPDTIQIFPQRLLQCYRESLLCDKGSLRWCSFAREFLFYNMRCRLGRARVDFLYSVRSDPNSAKCANPIYLQLDRVTEDKPCNPNDAQREGM